MFLSLAAVSSDRSAAAAAVAAGALGLAAGTGWAYTGVGKWIGTGVVDKLALQGTQQGTDLDLVRDTLPLLRALCLCKSCRNTHTHTHTVYKYLSYSHVVNNDAKLHDNYK